MEIKNAGLKKLKGSITSPKGFQATGSHIGIKDCKKDLAIIYSEVPAKVVGVFTTNVVKASSILWNQNLIQNQNGARAIIVNSGNANACTGEVGARHTELMATELASCLGVNKNQVLVASTGIIGVPLPIDTIVAGINNTFKKLGNTNLDANLAAEAIMTTDTHPKQISVEFTIDDKKIRIGGIAKGSGMIHPNMATMLSFITTDINISKKLLNKALKKSADDSYNMISVDGDTSTNDLVILLANGLGGNSEIKEENEEYYLFQKALHYVNLFLAHEIVKDGEGAKKFIAVKVTGAASKKDAKLLSKSVITSNLVKTAFFGEDANWGRILAAMGYSGANFNPTGVTIKFQNGLHSIMLMQDGTPLQFDEELALIILRENEITVELLLKEGTGEAIAWGCDLSYEYVRINGDYRS
ncbi:MAG: bifunctional glutamate N-acetyltransferase/amino-acid acetyltransferase ArgJ [Candidatus Lokiarchaeota archaeon]|nr:bifunctional glutamate N-acetyltransferase/amino-acid acetyltransferase ArgJ [Candidatus Lokiarchaeota archaeon]